MCLEFLLGAEQLVLGIRGAQNLVEISIITESSVACRLFSFHDLITVRNIFVYFPACKIKLVNTLEFTVEKWSLPLA